MKILYWLPRVLGIIYILFLAIFALDVFIPGQTISYYFVALFMHLIPNFILTAVLILSWKIEKLGGLVFILVGILMASFFKNPFWVNFILLGPLFLIGSLFFIHGHLVTKKGENEN